MTDFLFQSRYQIVDLKSRTAGIKGHLFRYFWKILVDPKANQGVAFVGVNNIHINENEIDSFKLCPTLDNHPIMQDIANPDTITKGVLYACEVDEISDDFDEIPNLGNLGLLT